MTAPKSAPVAGDEAKLLHGMTVEDVERQPAECLSILRGMTTARVVTVYKDGTWLEMPYLDVAIAQTEDDYLVSIPLGELSARPTAAPALSVDQGSSLRDTQRAEVKSVLDAPIMALLLDFLDGKSLTVPASEAPTIRDAATAIRGLGALVDEHRAGDAQMGRWMDGVQDLLDALAATPAPLQPGIGRQTAEPLEIAYGCLWRTATDDISLHAARRSIGFVIGRDGCARGVAWAVANLAPTTDDEIRNIEL